MQLLGLTVILISMENVRIKVVSNWNYSLLPSHKESGFGPSRTQPNDVLSVEEIIRRSSNGIPLGNMRQGEYDDPDVDLPDDYYQMDKLERIQYSRDRAEELAHLKQEYEDQRKEAARKKAAAKSDAVPPPSSKVEAPEAPPADPE